MGGRTVTISQERYDALIKLQQAALIACSNDAWDKERQQRWYELTGERECLWGHLYHLARIVPEGSEHEPSD